MELSIKQTITQGKGFYRTTYYTVTAVLQPPKQENDVDEEINMMLEEEAGKAEEKEGNDGKRGTQAVPDFVTVNKKYSDFSKLRKNMVAKAPSVPVKSESSSSQVKKEPVPALPRSKYFGLFDPQLIEYRKTEFQKLLNFAATHSDVYGDVLKMWLGLVARRSDGRVLANMDPAQVVIEKLIRMNNGDSTPLDREFLENKARVLSNKEHLKQIYLDFDWTVTKQIYMEVKQTSSNKKALTSSSAPSTSATKTPSSSTLTHENNNNNNPASTSGSGSTSALMFVSAPLASTSTETGRVGGVHIPPASNQQQSQELDGGAGPKSKAESGAQTEADERIPEYDEDEAMFLKNYNPTLEKNKKQKLRIKLVVTEITNKASTKSIRKILCPIVDVIGPYFDKSLPKFGLFHSALIVGPWYIEWNASELCVPRKIMSRAALLSCDIDGIAVEREKIEEIREKLSQVITRWNTTKRYRNDPKDRTVEGNCQDFIDDVLEHLNIDTSSIFTGPLGEFLKNLRTKGVCQMEFRMTPEFRQQFGISETTKTFQSHLELDEFVIDLMNKDRDFQRKYTQEMTLLKSFDRAFWLRFLREKDEKYKPKDPTQIDKTTGCPFDNPVDTRSFAMDRL